jgi:hypothetical protein
MRLEMDGPLAAHADADADAENVFEAARVVILIKKMLFKKVLFGLESRLFWPRWLLQYSENGVWLAQNMRVGPRIPVVI